MEGTGIHWSEMYSHKRELNGRYPTIWDVPTAKKMTDVLASALTGKDRLLDVGAFERGLEGKLKERFPGVVYRSMDADRGRTHDYYSLDDVRERFDVVVLSEVIEHIPLKEGVALMRKSAELLEPGGRMVVTTPNTFMPSRFLSDPSHVTPYAYDELGGILMSLGLKIRVIRRLYNDAFLRRVTRIYVTGWLYRWFGIDYAKSIAVVAEREGK